MYGVECYPCQVSDLSCFNWGVRGCFTATRSKTWRGSGVALLWLGEEGKIYPSNIQWKRHLECEAIFFLVGKSIQAAAVLAVSGYLSDIGIGQFCVFEKSRAKVVSATSGQIYCYKAWYHMVVPEQRFCKVAVAISAKLVFFLRRWHSKR